MFTRIVECRAKTGRGEEAVKKVRLEVLPILQKQPGFVDLIVLRDGNDQKRVMCLSFWNTKESAEHYHREHYDSIVHALRSELDATPTLETLQVEASTAHQIASSRAA
jgi:heme-degrading monooxygenase HmoA